MYKVVVADDHAVVRTGLQLIFKMGSNLEVYREVENGIKLLEVLQEEAFDAAVIDLNMPGKDSLDLIQEVRKNYPQLPIVIYTMNADEQLSLRLFKIGVMGYIHKEAQPTDLVQAVEMAIKGRKYLTPEQKEWFATQMLKGETEALPHERLTDREYQILCLLAAGSSNADIAIKLCISKNTISNHRNNILKKLNLVNNAELTRYAIKQQLIN